MKRIAVMLLVGWMVMAGVGCGDPRDPVYWAKKIRVRSERDMAMKRLSEMFGRLKAENNNDMNAGPVKGFTDKVVPELAKAYGEIKRDRINRLEIIKLLSQMNNPKANEVYLASLDVNAVYEPKAFVISAEALSRAGMVEAVPKLLAAHQELVGERAVRGGPFTTRENEMEEAVVNGLITIIQKSPNIGERGKMVEVLNAVADTRDTKQDLRINMKAVKGLGQIGDASSIPTLVRAIAMMGEVQKVGLGPFAFVSLQQIADRDAVVEAMIAFATGQDAAFNDYFQEELETDAVLKVPVWRRQQAIDFLGLLNYPSAKAVAFLKEEMNHNEPDATDRESAAKGEGAQKFDENQWAAWRRNWATVALSQLGEKTVLGVVKERFKVKKGKGGGTELEVTVEEAVGYLRALGYLQYPEETCGLLLDAAKTGSESLRDKTLYHAGTMGCTEVLPVMKQEYDKIDCKKMIAERFPEDAADDEKKKAEMDCETLKGRIKTYMDEILFAKNCGKDFECFLKGATDRGSPLIEGAIYGAYRLARGDEGKSKQLVETLTKELDNPVMAALEANIFALDRLTPNGDKALLEQADQVRKGFASQQAYKDRARLVDAFLGHVKARTK